MQLRVRAAPGRASAGEERLCKIAQNLQDNAVNGESDESRDETPERL